jgi:hypothetical protein
MSNLSLAHPTNLPPTLLNLPAPHASVPIGRDQSVGGGTPSNGGDAIVARLGEGVVVWGDGGGGAGGA